MRPPRRYYPRLHRSRAGRVHPAPSIRPEGLGRMRTRSTTLTGLVIWLVVVATAPLRAGQSDPLAAPLPRDVKAVWDVGRAWREATATRERVCVNGLWRWQPADDASPTGNTAVPAGGWGY